MSCPLSINSKSNFLESSLWKANHTFHVLRTLGAFQYSWLVPQNANT